MSDYTAFHARMLEKYSDAEVGDECGQYILIQKGADPEYTYEEYDPDFRVWKKIGNFNASIKTDMVRRLKSSGFPVHINSRITELTDFLIDMYLENDEVNEKVKSHFEVLKITREKRIKEREEYNGAPLDFTSCTSKTNPTLSEYKKQLLYKQKMRDLIPADPKLLCPHCDKQLKQKHQFNNWHGDNCKLNPNKVNHEN